MGSVHASPRIFRLALTMAGLEPHEVWYCGDNPALSA